jgi:hypothetical protein
MDDPVEGDRVVVKLNGKETTAVVLQRTRLQLRVEHAAGTRWIALSDVVSVDSRSGTEPAPAAASEAPSGVKEPANIGPHGYSLSIERCFVAYVAYHVSPLVRSLAGQSQEAQEKSWLSKAAATAAVSIADLKAKVGFNPAIMMGGQVPKPSTEPAAADPAQGT